MATGKVITKRYSEPAFNELVLKSLYYNLDGSDYIRNTENMKMLTDKIESRIKLQEKVILKHHKEMQKHFDNYKDSVTTVDVGNRRIRKISSMNDIYDPHLHLSSPRRGYAGMYLQNGGDPKTERAARPYSLSPTLKAYSDPSNSNASSRYSSPSARKLHAIAESKRNKNGYVDIHDLKTSKTEKKNSSIRKINLDTPVYQRPSKTETPVVSDNMIYFDPYGNVAESQGKLPGVSPKYSGRSNVINEEYKALYRTLNDELEMMKEQQQREIIQRRLSLQDSEEIKESKKHMEMMKEQMDFMQKQMEKVVRHVEAINTETGTVAQSQAPVRLQQNIPNDPKQDHSQKHKQTHHAVKHGHSHNQKSVTKHQHRSHHEQHDPKPSEQPQQSTDHKPAQQSDHNPPHQSNAKYHHNHNQHNHAVPKQKQSTKKQNDNHQYPAAKSHEHQVSGNGHDNDHVAKHYDRNLHPRKPEENSRNIKQNGHGQQNGHTHSAKQKELDHSPKKQNGNHSDKHENKTSEGNQTHTGRNQHLHGSHSHNGRHHSHTGRNRHTNTGSQTERKAETAKQKPALKKSGKQDENQNDNKQNTSKTNNSNPGVALNKPKKGSLKKSESFKIMGRSKNFFGYLSLTDDNLKNRKRRVKFSEEGERPGTA